jgi:hypothetical protein
VLWKLMVVGIGFGLMLSPLSAAALNAVTRERSGLASSVANSTRQTGTVIGIALLAAAIAAVALRPARSAAPAAAADVVSADRVAPPVAVDASAVGE